MSKQEKIQKLLKWNKENHKTFAERASNARLICMADEAGLDFMLEAALNGGN